MPALKWSVPRGEWAGQKAFILGGGPSLKGFDAERLRGKGRVIAVNDAGLHLAPWADILFWSDRRWLDWNVAYLHRHIGPWKVARREPHIETGHEVKWLTFRPRHLSRDPEAVGGMCGGSSAINLAFLLGAGPIVLLGFDMHDLPMDRWQDGNWHSNHQKPPVRNQRREKFVPCIEMMARDLKAERVSVFNATPGSALKCFPIVTIDEVL